MKELIQFLKMLADDSRLRIIHLLEQREMSVTDICTVLDMSQSAVSKHLVKLRLLGVVTDVREGSFIIYSLNNDNDMYVKVIRFIIKHFGSIDTFQADTAKLESININANGI